MASSSAAMIAAIAWLLTNLALPCRRPVQVVGHDGGPRGRPGDGPGQCVLNRDLFDVAPALITHPVSDLGPVLIAV